jgi:hypothetical protein
VLDLLFKHVKFILTGACCCQNCWIGGRSHKIGLCLPSTVASNDFLVIMKSLHLSVNIVLLRDLCTKLESQIVSAVICRCFRIRYEFMYLTLFTIEMLGKRVAYLVVYWLC